MAFSLEYRYMEKLIVHNTLTRKKEEFLPAGRHGKALKGKKVGFYYCGPTVYWTQHIGNLRGSFCADIVHRTLEYFGYNVKMVRNYTDVGHLVSDEDMGEDKMEKAVKREGGDPLSIAEKYIEIYENDTRDLNIEEPWKKPRATKHIKEMQKMVAVLLKKGFAYSTPLAIYFDISKFPNYTALSGQDLAKNIAGEGKGEISDPNKKNPQDFAVWFFRAGAHKNALQFWTSPFESTEVKNGEGFPGWHLECSAMAKKYLGETIDLHMGGIEHIPVHHTNEIAQSEAANGKKFVNYWLHNAHLLVDNEKMAKSKGTGFTLNEIKEKGFSPLALRYFFLSAHYRSNQNFTWEALEAAQNGLNHLYKQLKNSPPSEGLGEGKKSPLLRGVAEGRGVLVKRGAVDKTFKAKFICAIGDDFNTSGALAILSEMLKSDLSPADKVVTALDFDKVLGLNFKEALNKKEEKLPTEILNLVELRKKAREEKNWAESDRLRLEIEKIGYSLEDTKEGMKVFKK